MGYNAEIAIAFKAGLHIPADAQDVLNIFDHKRENALGTYYYAEYIPWNDFVYEPIHNFIDKLNELDMTELYAFVEVGDNDEHDASGNTEYFQLNWHTEIDHPFVRWDKGEEENLIAKTNTPNLLDMELGKGFDDIMRKVIWYNSLPTKYAQQLTTETYGVYKPVITVNDCIKVYDYYESILANSDVIKTQFPDPTPEPKKFNL